MILHPDKFQQSGYTVEQKMIAERCFSILREAHDYFEAELKGKPQSFQPNTGPPNNASHMYPNSGYYPTGGGGGGGNPNAGGYPPPPPPYANGAYYPPPPQGNMPFGGVGGMYGAPPPPPPYGWDPRMGQKRYPPY